MSVLIVTSLGDIVVDLFTDKCPLTSKNFLKLCKIKYYNGCLFHTVQKDFTAQTGDPTGTGTSGDSVYKFLYGEQARFFSDEIHLDLKHSKTGTVAMASAGENLNASQFYFTLRDDLDYLDGKHTVFGEVAEGFETLSRINEAYVDEKNRPYKNIRIKHTYILDDPFDDPPQLVELIPEASPEGKPKDEVDDNVRLEDDWVPMDEQLGAAELEEVLRSKDAHSSAVVLETIGDIPDAEIKPPDNVLFVCKLNPVTEDEDLHTIFSRFGTVISAEIIRDYKTGDSLCYAFIEFENKEACEQAYFKMDNALIDDRRIHVDFSQSVAKLWSQYRRKDSQMGRGGGCFKCGSLDHIAKDCTGSSATNQHPKYILKEDNRQHGGDNYEMVFDEDASGSPKREKRRRDHDQDERLEKQKTSRRVPHDLQDGDRQKKYSTDRHRQKDERSSEDGMHRDRRASQSGGNRRDMDFLEESGDGKKPMERHRERDENRRDERDYRRQTGYMDGHRDGRDNGEYRKRSVDNRKERGDGGDYRKRDVDNDHHVGRDDGDRSRRGADTGSQGDRRDDRDYGKRNADGNREELRNGDSYRKSSAVDERYKGRKEEREPRHHSRTKDYDNKGRREEREPRHRSDRR